MGGERRSLRTLGKLPNFSQVRCGVNFEQQPSHRRPMIGGVGIFGCLNNLTKESPMAGKNTAVFGIYSSGRRAEGAVDTLKAEGFRKTDVSVLLPENEGTKDFAHTKQTKAPEGATAGAGAGAVLGGALG